MAEGWARALPRIAATAHSEHSWLLVQNARREAEFIAGVGMNPEYVAGFGEAAAKGDSWYWEMIHALPTGVVAPNSAIVSDSEFTRSTFYNEGIRPIGAFHGMLVSPLRTARRTVYLMAGRLLGREDFDGEDVAALRTLVPHFVTALRTGARIAAADLQSKAVEAALDRLNAGVILVDATAKIVFANRVAQATLDQPGSLGVDEEGLCVPDRGATWALRRLIATCADTTIVGGGPGGSMEVPRKSGRPLQMIVAPLRTEATQIDMGWLGSARPAAIVTITDPDRQRRLRKDDLCRRFGLTSAEADVALEILKGDGREATAARLGIAAATVRGHLSHIFDKAGVRRQAELVRLLLQDIPK